MFNSSHTDRSEVVKGADEWLRFTRSISKSDIPEDGRERLRALVESVERALQAEREGKPDISVHIWERQLGLSPPICSPGERAIVAFCNLMLGRAILMSGKYQDGCNAINLGIKLADTAEKVIPPSFILDALQALTNAHRKHGRWGEVIKNLGRASKIINYYYGPRSAQAAEVAFEEILALEAVRAIQCEPDLDLDPAMLASIERADGLISDPACRLTKSRRANLLLELGNRQYTYGEWRSAERTLKTCMNLLDVEQDSPKMVSCLLILAHIFVHQQRPSDVDACLSSLEKFPDHRTQGAQNAVDAIRIMMNSASVSRPPSAGHNPSDPPHLIAIKNLLRRGYQQLRAGTPDAAHGSLEGAQALIALHYNDRHPLWAKADVLIARACADQANAQVKVGRDPTDFLMSGRKRALSAWYVMRDLGWGTNDRRGALTMALKFSQALEDEQDTLRIRRMLERESFEQL